MTDREVYSKLRGQIMKRASRIKSAGLPVDAQFPILREMSPRRLSKEIKRAREWLDNPTNTVKGAREAEAAKAVAEALKKERRRQQNREAQRRHRERLAALTDVEMEYYQITRDLKIRGVNLSNVKTYIAKNKKLLALYKSAQSLGITLESIDQLQQFADYVTYRDAQRRDQAFYEFDKWLEDFMVAQEADVSTEQIIEDFEDYLRDMADLLESGISDEALSEMDFSELLSEMIQRYGSD